MNALDDFRIMRRKFLLTSCQGPMLVFRLNFAFSLQRQTTLVSEAETAVASEISFVIGSQPSSPELPPIAEEKKEEEVRRRGKRRKKRRKRKKGSKIRKMLRDRGERNQHSEITPLVSLLAEHPTVANLALTARSQVSRLHRSLRFSPELQSDRNAVFSL